MQNVNFASLIRNISLDLLAPVVSFISHDVGTHIWVTFPLRSIVGQATAM
jgi:hypothetical protein